MSSGFFVDLDHCIGCRTCQVACKDRRDIQTAGARLRRVDSYESGSYPDASIYHVVMSCNHCEDPACVRSCPTGSMFKSDDGTVQHDDEHCIVCRQCTMACPYNAPQYVEERNNIEKCDTCRTLREAGQNPVCVDACPMRAIEYGDIDELKSKHPDAVSDIPAIPSSSITRPNLLVKAHKSSESADYKKVAL